MGSSVLKVLKSKGFVILQKRVVHQLILSQDLYLREIIVPKNLQLICSLIFNIGQ